MSLFEAFSYKGKRAVVVGGATGMGAGVAEVVRDAGAEVVVLDRAAVTLDGVTGLSLDLADRASIDAAVQAIGGCVDALFSCAGVADGTPGIEKINFLGHRHLIDGLRSSGALTRGSAIGFISSAAGLGWANSLDVLTTYLDISDMDEASAWAIENKKADYFWSKRAVCAYVAREAYPLMREGIRINATMPGPTDTPLARANADMWLSFGADYREDIGTEASTPVDQAYPLVFLCSDAARSVSGVTLVTDMGYLSSGLTNSYPAAQPMYELLSG